MYHRVLPEGERDGVQAGMYVKPESFEAHLIYLKKHFKIISLSELFTYLPSPPFRKGEKNQKPWCILTFDDGWYDFYEYAFPILKKFEAPATVFLSTDFIGTNKWFWTDRLINLLLHKQKAGSMEQGIKDKGLGKERKKQGEEDKEQLRSSKGVVNQIENLKGPYESRMEKAIQILKPYRDEEIEEILSELSSRWSLIPDPQERPFLSWEEVREMAQSGLITFGSHTASHRILTTLGDDEIRDELMQSKDRLISEKVIDPSFIPFCYPNGNYNEKIVKMVKEAGYSLAVTTDNGWNTFGSDPFTLKRIGIHQDMASSEAMFGCRIIKLF